MSARTTPDTIAASTLIIMLDTLLTGVGIVALLGVLGAAYTAFLVLRGRNK